MTAKEYLGRYYKTKQKIQSLQSLVDEYIRLANEIPGIQFDAIRVDGTRNLKAPFEKWILKALDYEDDILEMKRLLPTYEKEIFEAIDLIEEDNYKKLLIYRYIDNLSWQEISNRLFISRSTVKRWHLKALSLLKI
jgi:DNA-directed RNA polymerase specialized sigma24 family protein